LRSQLHFIKGFCTEEQLDISQYGNTFVNMMGAMKRLKDFDNSRLKEKNYLRNAISEYN
jgi:hypothetical protein